MSTRSPGIADFFERGRRELSNATMIATVDEATLIAALRDGDEAAFAQLVDQHTPSMLRVARGYVPSHEIAEEVVQETWIALVKGIDRFEGRHRFALGFSAVMINIAKARGVRERRDADAAIAAYTGGTVDPARFRGSDDPYPGHWMPDEVPSPFPDTPEGSVLGSELVDVGTPRTRQAARAAADRRHTARHARVRLKRGV